MDLTSFARVLGGARRLEGASASRPTNVSRIVGVAVADSADGRVLVSLDAQVFSGDGSQYVELPTSSNVREGDIVYVDMVGADGKGKSLMVSGAAGSGDRQQGEIDTAAHAAEVAWDWADEAHNAADAAWEWADDAHDAAESAQGSAEAAAASAADALAGATRANTAANSALTQLSVVEDVAGTLQWIVDHGTFVRTTDTTVHEGTVYFAYVDGDYVPIAEPTGNPAAMGWYVLDVSQSQSDYIMSHLAVTSRGLWVLPNGYGTATDAQQAPGYKMLLSSSGSYLYDDTGALVMSYGESITMASSRPQYIGGQNAYIRYYDSDNDGLPDSIDIVGTSLNLALNDKVSEDGVIAAINASTEASGGTALKIAASKVEIDGTAVFNAISQNVDNAITSKGYVDGGETVKKTHRLWYRSSSATAPNAPTSWITRNTSVSNSWTEMHVAITSTYKYVYTCEQYQRPDNTLGTTAVTRDNTITTIDGGSIIASTVTATQINADTLTRIGPTNSRHIVIDTDSFDFKNGSTEVATLEALTSSGTTQVNLRLDGGFGTNYLSAYTGYVDAQGLLTSSLSAHYYGTPTQSDGNLNLTSLSTRANASTSDVYFQARDLTVLSNKTMSIYHAPIDNFGHLIRSRVDVAWGVIRNVGANSGGTITLTWLGGGFEDANYLVAISRMTNPTGFTKVNCAISGRTKTTVTVAYWNDGSTTVGEMSVGVIGADSRYGTIN